jgi:hypothetical protein
MKRFITSAFLILSGCSSVLGQYYKPQPGYTEFKSGPQFDKIECYTTKYNTPVYRHGNLEKCPSKKEVEHMQWFFYEHFKYSFGEGYPSDVITFYKEMKGIVFTSQKMYHTYTEKRTKIRQNARGFYDKGYAAVWLRGRYSRWGYTLMHEICHWQNDFYKGDEDKKHKTYCYDIKPPTWPEERP